MSPVVSSTTARTSCIARTFALLSFAITSSWDTPVRAMSCSLKTPSRTRITGLFSREFLIPPIDFR